MEFHYKEQYKEGNTIQLSFDFFALEFDFAQNKTTALKSDSCRKLHTQTALKYDISFMSQNLQSYAF